MERLELLKELSFGSQVAENEVASLQEYFVQTDQWNRIFKGEIDIIRGEKGAGKSAIYLLLDKNREKLFDSGVLIVSAENPRGTTVFKDLIADPPATEQEFVVLWKIYILTIICHELRSFDVHGEGIEEVFSALEEEKLLERELNLAGLLRLAQSFARRILRIKGFETELPLDPVTGMPVSIIGRFSLVEPTGELRSQGIMSLDGMFEKANRALEKSGLGIWVLLDRLDVAFAESHELEANAIRALLRVYSDLRGMEKISLKIFLREDIWRRVTSEGMREASHLTSFVKMSWTTATLLNLTLRRILNNPILVAEFAIDKEAVLADAQQQKELFYRFFPAQIEQGERKATTFDWMVGRCADGTGNTAPRELIHLLNCVREEEIRRLERGENPAVGDQLFDRAVFKAALPAVSQNRLDTYLYAEYATEKPFIEKLKAEKCEQTLDSLMEIWSLPRERALGKSRELVELGFFQERGTKAEPTFWVSFLYRDALGLIQGKAGVSGTVTYDQEADN